MLSTQQQRCLVKALESRRFRVSNFVSLARKAHFVRCKTTRSFQLTHQAYEVNVFGRGRGVIHMHAESAELLEEFRLNVVLVLH